MVLFRLFSFFLRVAGSFFFVYVLQTQFFGKTLENHLTDFNKKFILTRSLKKVSQDGAKVMREAFSLEEGKTKKSRQISSDTAGQYFKNFSKDFSKQIQLLTDPENQDSESIEQSSSKAIEDFSKQHIETIMQNTPRPKIFSKMIKKVFSSGDKEGEESEARQISSSKAAQYVKEFTKQMTLPASDLKEEEQEKEASE